MQVAIAQSTGVVMTLLRAMLTEPAIAVQTAAVAGRRPTGPTSATSLAMAGLSGALIIMWPPIFRAEGWLGTLARLTPHGPALEGYTRLLVEQGTLADVLAPVGALLLYSLIYAGIAAWRIRAMWR
jgi:hypothetical protein